MHLFNICIKATKSSLHAIYSGNTGEITSQAVIDHYRQFIWFCNIYVRWECENKCRKNINCSITWCLVGIRDEKYFLERKQTAFVSKDGLCLKAAPQITSRHSLL